MKYFFVLNPGSRSGKSRKVIDRLMKLLEVSGLNHEHEYTHSLTDAQRLSENANKEGFDVIVAVGGDGTINGVINGFFDAGGKRISEARFGVIYTGTSPDFCKSYNLPLHLDEAFSRLLNMKVIKIPIGRIVFPAFERDPDKDGEPKKEVKYFACCANIGLGAALARRANGGVRKILGDGMGTFMSLIVTLARYKANTFTRTIDGIEEPVGRMYNTSVGLTPFIASGIKVFLDKELNGNSFYCMTVKGLKWYNVVPLLRKVYSGKVFANTDYLTVRTCRIVEFHENGRNPEVEFDGDPGGFLPCRIDIASDPLDLIA